MTEDAPTSYRILKRIGAGSMAEVFVAHLEAEGVVFEELVAVKRMLPHLQSDPRAVEMFLDEAELSTRLHHPNIARVVHVERNVHDPFIALEYVDGVSVAELVERRGEVQLDPEIAVFIARELSAALAFAHQLTDDKGEKLDVVHRDVSPENILVSRAGTVKLIDFGIARARGRSRRTRTGAIMGKTLFMSPEQALGQKASAASDLFSVGSVLYFLLVGQPAFDGASELDRMTAVAHAQHRRVADVDPLLPSNLDELVEELLVQRAEDRIGSAAELTSRLSHALASLGASPEMKASPELGTLVQKHCGPSDIFFDDFDEPTPTAS